MIKVEKVNNMDRLVEIILDSIDYEEIVNSVIDRLDDYCFEKDNWIFRNNKYEQNKYIMLNVKYRPNIDSLTHIIEEIEQYNEDIWESIQIRVDNAINTFWESLSDLVYSKFGLSLCIDGRNGGYWGFELDELRNYLKEVTDLDVVKNIVYNYVLENIDYENLEDEFASAIENEENYIIDKITEYIDEMIYDDMMSDPFYYLNFDKIWEIYEFVEDEINEAEEEFLKELREDLREELLEFKNEIGG